MSAKVVAKAHSKVRYGYVTVASPEHAQRCIAELNGTELKGSTITVEKVRECERVLSVSVHCDGVRIYCIAGFFRGRKLLRISSFCGDSRN